ncbi:polynucleotide kinase-phosphatase [Leucobacter viscericola]|uniref:Polynucleotide kinase-phosphatase n=2 Tax=Leucobacter viscericola TaxID=2714935 RepID=A0A6G7XKG5_9MICO|nr:polynucleotide kinase-phosphatase [Leucobacter viscericola]
MNNERGSALAIPNMSLVVLIGASGSGKSTFARKHFGEFEVLSSDTFRGMVSNDENDQAATTAAFEALQFVAGKRLDAGLLTVIDATSVQPSARKELVALAREHDVLPVAIVFDLPESLCVARNAERTEAGSSRTVPAGAVKRQSDQLRRSLRNLGREGFRRVHILRDEDQVNAATIQREPLLNDRSWDRGPFDVIGDVHGCRSELESLLTKLGYEITRDEQGRPTDALHPEGRRALFLGDLVDRGPDSAGVLRLVMGMVGAEHALAVPGNHEAKLVRALRGAKVTTSHGLAETLAQLSGETAEFRDQVVEFCDGLVAHLVLDGGDLVVAHAGLKEQYHGRASGRVREYALYGETTGETDEYGLPVRLPWAKDYRGKAAVLYGHTPVPEVVWTNNTACLDTACAFGGSLSALRYPEREVVQVPAEQQWAEPVRPIQPLIPEREPGILRLDDVQGRIRVETSTHGRIGIDEKQSAGGLETMSRWAIDPRWLLYLPPTMSPPKTSTVPGFLEHPQEAFEYFLKEGITEVICEEKHMGSRATVLVARDPARFGAPAHWRGAIYTRTGRPFFDAAAELEYLKKMDRALEASGVWEELDADWILLDGEMLPWSLKAGDLIRDLYASVSASGLAATGAANRALAAAADSGLDVAALSERIKDRHDDLERFRDSYRRYVGQADEVRFAPFQILAAGDNTFERRDHGWHLAIADRLVAEAPELFQATGRLRVDLEDPAQTESAVQWWLSLTSAEHGGEGMVVKPFANLTRTAKGLVQPGIKVRGREYLRIIYGPSYTEERDLKRLRERNTGQKRSLAGREYALGIEALHRVARSEPVWRIHEAVFAILALESDPIDPRL